MATAVDAVFVGKERAFNRRFLQLMSHHLVELTACTPWEKGQVENQVGVVRKRFFSPRPSLKTLENLNGWLVEKCIAYELSVGDHIERFMDKPIAKAGKVLIVLTPEYKRKAEA